MSPNVKTNPDTGDQEALKGHALKGGEQTADRLEELRVLEQARESGEELVISRAVNAPRDLVFQAWTEPERLLRWWGPAGMQMDIARLELKPGGTFLYSMRGPAGSPMAGPLWGKFEYREITAPSKIVFTNSFCDEQGNPTRHPLAPTWPLRVLNVLTLEERGGKTLLELRGGPFHATAEERQTFAVGRASMEAGFGGTFQQLEAYLASVL